MKTFLDLAKTRRSIRKYQDKQISKSDLEKIIEAGIYAPNAGGGQRSYVVGCQDKVLNERLGKLNVGGLDRANLIGGYVSSEQPSIIDDPSIKSGFYGAPTVISIFCPSNFLYSVADAFCMAENMCLQAHELGIGSCIIARGEETFDNAFGEQVMKNWAVPDGFIAECFVLLGYVDGAYPQGKERKIDRYKIID